MARIRSIKPEFWSSPKIGELDPYWRLLFVAMWNWADDYGRGTCEPRELMGFAFPHDDEMTVEDFRRGLGGIRRVFGVKFYRVAGRSYYSIPTWELHQKIDKRAKGSKYPAPEEGEPLDPEKWQVIQHPKNPTEDSKNPTEDSGENSEPSVLEQGNRGTGEQGNRKRTNAQTKFERTLNPNPSETIPDTTNGYPNGFEKWWSTYPRKVGKRKAYEAWYRALKRITPHELQDATQRLANFHTQQNTDQQFIPHPATWLNRDGWDDTLTPRAQPLTGRLDEAEMWRQLNNPPPTYIDGEIIHQRQIG